MKSIYYILLSITLATISCKKDKRINLQSSLGCVHEDSDEIKAIPYLTTYSELVSAISVGKNFEFDIYLNDGNAVASTVQTNYLLGIKKKDKIIKYYTLQKQELEAEVAINGEYTDLDITSQCGDISSSEATRRTAWFDAKKDSTYTVYAWNGDSAQGVGILSASDSTGHRYIENKYAGTNSGAGCIGDPCEDANQYSFTSQITGKIYIEAHGVHNGANEHHTLNTSMRIWVRQ